MRLKQELKKLQSKDRSKMSESEKEKDDKDIRDIKKALENVKDS